MGRTWCTRGRSRTEESLGNGWMQTDEGLHGVENKEPRGRERERERERLKINHWDGEEGEVGAEHCMARHGMSRVLSRSCRGIQTWLSPTSLQYPLWHFLWCEWGRIHSHPTQVVYCFCLRRLTQRPRLRTRLASLCRRPVLAGDSCHASGKTLGRQLKQDTSFGIFFFGWRFLCVFFSPVTL